MQCVQMVADVVGANGVPLIDVERADECREIAAVRAERMRRVLFFVLQMLDEASDVGVKRVHVAVSGAAIAHAAAIAPERATDTSPM